MPLLGLGLYGGHRGNRWLKNRIKIFKQFVLPSLLAQTNRDFVLWVSVRHEDRNSVIIKEFKAFLESQLPTVFTYSGVCFWDDKYPDDEARARLVDAVHSSVGELHNFIGSAEEVLMSIQPSDDCYYSGMVEEAQTFFRGQSDIHVLGYKMGYVMDYLTGRIKEWNPTTTPPFYTIRFPRETFTDPLKHLNYTGPYKSHEYVKDHLPALYRDFRGFLVGTHGENISTIFKHPFATTNVSSNVLEEFGMQDVGLLKLKPSFRKWFMRQLPHNWRRKLRYIFGERIGQRVYNWLRS